LEKDIEKQSGKILIVDDNLDILNLVSFWLRAAGYKTVPAENGREGLDLASTEAPDAILLDVMMPDIDGYEVCQRLKANEETKDIPVLFVSAKTEIDDRIMGLSSGGHDYICKPIEPQELLARVDAALRIKRMQDELKQKIALQVELDRAHQLLMHQDKMATLGELAASIAHEVNNPLTIISGNAELLMRQVTFADPTIQKRLERIYTNAQRAAERLRSLLTIARPDPKAWVDLNRIVRDVLILLDYRLTKTTVKVDCRLDPDLKPLRGNQNEIAQAVFNLVRNAIDAVQERDDGLVQIETRTNSKGEITLSIVDNGHGIPPEIAPRIFEPFFTTRGGKHAGLGLHVVRQVFEQHHGIISWRSQSNRTEFVVSLSASATECREQSAQSA